MVITGSPRFCQTKPQVYKGVAEQGFSFGRRRAVVWNWIAQRIADIRASISIYINVAVTVVVNKAAKLAGRR